MSARRRWLLALLTATLAPLLLLALLEAALRLAGFGYSADFWVPVPGREVLTTNQRFGWRFFPPRLARAPVVCELPAKKADGSFRIFVLGGSAAMGTPDPAYGVGRILQVMLEDAFDDLRFEVVNAAMAAINSHVVLEIGRSCAAHAPDLFLVYMGHNEVVGPYGPGTVFQGFSSNLRLIRLSSWAKGTRSGQLMTAGMRRLRGRAAGPGRWRGMEMFSEHELAAGDPRLAAVYSHLRANLEGLLATLSAEAPVVVSTVACNLRDSPPFASRPSKDLTPEERAAWQAAYHEGMELQQAGRPEEAAEPLRRALALDDGHAELHFRLGQVELAQGRAEAARRHLVEARDLDALRFRADSRINQVVEEVARKREKERIYFFDGEKLLASASEDGLPGAELFWEHVHLRFGGNYELARGLFEVVHPLIEGTGARARTGPASPLPRRVCARRLALTVRDRTEMTVAIHDLTRRPPFTGQAGHAASLAAQRQELGRLRRLARQRSEEVETTYRKALGRRPGDLFLRQKLAALLAESGRYAEAVDEWTRLVERLPGVPAWHTALGFALADAGRLGEAEAEVRKVVQQAADSASALVNLGMILERSEEEERAAELYRRALALDPGLTAARFNLALLRERQGRVEEAVQLYRQVLGHDPASVQAHRRLAELLDRQGRLAEAAEAYRRALELDPASVDARNNLGFVLERQGRLREATAQYRMAVETDPSYALAYFNLADSLLAAGRPGEAVEVYRQGLVIEPDNLQGRYNLAICFHLTGQVAEAVHQLRRVLELDPSSVGALNNLALLLLKRPDAERRNVTEAVRLAQRAQRLSGGGSPEVLETLALAHAAAGRRQEAAATAAEALALAREQGKDDLVRRLEAFGAE